MKHYLTYLALCWGSYCCQMSSQSSCNAQKFQEEDIRFPNAFILDGYNEGPWNFHVANTIVTSFQEHICWIMYLKPAVGNHRSNRTGKLKIVILNMQRCCVSSSWLQNTHYLQQMNNVFTFDDWNNQVQKWGWHWVLHHSFGNTFWNHDSDGLVATIQHYCHDADWD